MLSMNSSSQFVPENYELLWQDEFEYRGKPDRKKWSHEEGLLRNLEKQYYTSRKKNSRVRNGMLEITARKEYIRNRKYEAGASNWKYYTKEAEYTSASIESLGKFEFQYGYVEVRAKLPAGQGVWPAIWMLGSDFESAVWPENGEIDILEHVGKDPEKIHATVHFPANNHVGYQSVGNTIQVEKPQEQFHIYGMEWTSEKIDFLVDGKIYHHFELSEAGDHADLFRKPFYLIINLALGGNWAGEVDPEIFPQKLLIDYVRVYQKK